jgi:hypothetical protein
MKADIAVLKRFLTAFVREVTFSNLLKNESCLLE